MIEPEDEKCLSCGHHFDDHRDGKCGGVYNVYDVHGDEQVGCLCKEYDDEKIVPNSQSDMDALSDIARVLAEDLS